MDDSRFWHLIGRLGPDLQVPRLRMALGALTWQETYDFTLHLKQKSLALDTRAHRLHACAAYEHPISDASTPPDDIDIHHDHQGEHLLAEFDDLAMTVVALGRDAWSAVVATPVLLASSWPTGLGRQLLAIAKHHLATSTSATIDAAGRQLRSIGHEPS